MLSARRVHEMNDLPVGMNLSKTTKTKCPDEVLATFFELRDSWVNFQFLSQEEMRCSGLRRVSVSFLTFEARPKAAKAVCGLRDDPRIHHLPHVRPMPRPISLSMRFLKQGPGDLFFRRS